MTVIISKIIQFTYFEMSHLQSQYRWQYICCVQYVQSFWTTNKGQKSNAVVTSWFKFMLTFCSIYPLSHVQLGFKIYSGTSVHERPYLRTIRFTNKFSQKTVSDDERCLGLRTRKLATAASWEYRRGSQLLVNFCSVHIPDWFRFTNISVHERPPGTD
jgi:hypothetical protein